MVSSVMCHRFKDIYTDWWLMYGEDPEKVSDSLFLKELRKARNQGDITIPSIYEQIVLSRKENMSRVRVLGRAVKFKKTVPNNVSSKCDLYISDNEFFDFDQAALKSAAVSKRATFGSFAFKMFEEVENDEYFLKKKVCKKGSLRSNQRLRH